MRTQNLILIPEMRRLCRVSLVEDIDAVPFVLDHLADAPHLADDPTKCRNDALRVRVAHNFVWRPGCVDTAAIVVGLGTLIALPLI